MEKYKRLTIKDKYKIIRVNQSRGDLLEDYQSLKNRLAELEDKIENGTLIELPCKVGDTVYEIDSCYCEYREHEVGGFSFEDGKLIIIDYFDNRYKASELCFTEAEVEKKLKELRNEK